MERQSIVLITIVFLSALVYTTIVSAQENRALLEDMCNENYDYNNIKDLEAGKFVCPNPEGLPNEVKKIIKDMFAQYDHHNEKLNHYQNLAFNHAKKIYWETDFGYIKGDELIRNLMTVPSVGELTALRWLAEIVSPLRFETATQLAAYCGCDPSLKVSAGKTTSHSRRKGNSKLHYQLMTVASTCINRHSEPFGRWGYAISKKHAKGGHKKGCGAVARRIAVAMYYVHKRNEPFRYDMYNFHKIDTPDIPITDMHLSKRLVNLLTANGLITSKAVVDSYVTSKIYEISGFGKKSAQDVSAWIQANRNKSSGRRVR